MPRAVPDWCRRAIRLSLSLLFFTSMGVTLWLLPEAWRADWGDEFVQSCNWAGATCAVVAASPLLGKVAQLSYERTLGTITGGLLGYLVYDYGVLYLPPQWDKVLMCGAAAAVGGLSCFLSDRFKLDASMRLFVITFLLVTFGAHPVQGAAAVALLRTGGILLGVVMFLLLSIIILPKSATMEALCELKKGLTMLADLNSMVWSTPPKPPEGGSSHHSSGALSRKASHAALCAVHHSHSANNISSSCTTNAAQTKPHDAAQGPAWMDPEAGEPAVSKPVQIPTADSKASEDVEAQCEKQLTDVYLSTFKVKEHVGLAANEAYVWHFWGHYLFLPVFIKGVALFSWGWRCLMGGKQEEERWAAIMSDIDIMGTCIRRMARLLWMLHLDYTESFDEGIQAQLRAAYPPELSRGALAAALGSALQELVAAFPGRTTIVVDHFHHFNQLVDRMLDISNAQRRAMLERLAAPPKPHRPKRTLQRNQSLLEPAGVSFVTTQPAAPAATAASPDWFAADAADLLVSSPAAGTSDARQLRQPLLQTVPSSSPAGVDGTAQRRTPLLSVVSVRDSRLATGRAPLSPFHAALLQQQQQLGAVEHDHQQQQQQLGATDLHQQQQQQQFEAIDQHLKQQQQPQQQQQRQLRQGAAAAAGGVAGPVRVSDPAHQEVGFLVPPAPVQPAPAVADATAAGAIAAPNGAAAAGSSLLSRALRDPTADQPQQEKQQQQSAPSAASAATQQRQDQVLEQQQQQQHSAASAAPQQRQAQVLEQVDTCSAASPAVYGTPPAAADSSSAEAAQQLLFPATNEGVAAEVRWYSFQFLMDEIAEELEELYWATSSLLGRLPYHHAA